MYTIYGLAYQIAGAFKPTADQFFFQQYSPVIFESGLVNLSEAQFLGLDELLCLFFIPDRQGNQLIVSAGYTSTSNGQAHK